MDNIAPKKKKKKALYSARHFAYEFYTLLQCYVYLEHWHDVNLCIIHKDTNFTHFASKMLHVNASKSVHICTFATITVHIYMVTIDLYFIFLIIFSLTFQVIFSLFSVNSLTLLHLTLFHHYLLYTNHQTNPRSRS